MTAATHAVPSVSSRFAAMFKRRRHLIPVPDAPAAGAASTGPEPGDMTPDSGRQWAPPYGGYRAAVKHTGHDTQPWRIPASLSPAGAVAFADQFTGRASDPFPGDDEPAAFTSAVFPGSQDPAMRMPSRPGDATEIFRPEFDPWPVAPRYAPEVSHETVTAMPATGGSYAPAPVFALPCVPDFAADFRELPLFRQTARAVGWCGLASPGSVRVPDFGLDRFSGVAA